MFFYVTFVLRSYLWSKRTFTISYLKIVPALLVCIILSHLQVELGDPELHHLPRWRHHRPLAIQLRLIVAVVVEVEAGDCAPALRQVDQPSAALIGSVGETSDGSEAARRDRAISSGHGLITD